MGKYHELLKKRIESGDIPVGYDLYNRTDVNGILPTLPASYGIVGRVGTTLIFEGSEPYINIKCNRDGGFIRAYEGDSVGITFAKSGNVHTPVTHLISRTITAMCDHDIGVVVRDE